MTPAPTDKPVGRAAILARGRKNRAVHRADAHIDTGPVDLVAIPAPVATDRTGALDDTERADLEICEQAISHAQRSLQVAGKALATIRDARLYRETHETWEEYLQERWAMKRTYAHRLIDAWPLAVAVLTIGNTNEGQIRELLPVSRAHGVETAAAVFAELQEQGGKMTAARIKDAVRVLPERIDSPEQAREAVRMAVADNLVPPREPDASETDRPLQNGRNPAALVQSLADLQERLYDQLGGGVMAEALEAEPGRTEANLRRIVNGALRTVSRGRKGLNPNG